MPRRYFNYDPRFQPLMVVSTVGSWLLGLAMVVTLAYLVVSLFVGERAGDNPWHSRSYEWYAPSPPPQHNFVSEPVFALGPYEYSAPFPGLAARRAFLARRARAGGLRTRSAFSASVSLEAGAPTTVEVFLPERVAESFESLEKQAHAVRLGMWVFLASEILFFAGLFALYAAYRTEHPTGFAVGVEHNTLVHGSVNTAVLLTSSFTVALAVHELRRGRPRAWWPSSVSRCSSARAFFA